MGRADIDPRHGVLRADLSALREFAALCESTAADLDAVITRARADASRLSGPGGCADGFRALCDDAGRCAVQLLRRAASRMRADGQRLNQAAAALRAADEQSAEAVEHARSDR